MALNYGFEKTYVTSSRKTLQYILNYPKAVLNSAVYPVRPGSLGYKYIPMNGINPNSTITLLTHSFATETGVNMDGGVITYAFEFLNKKNEFSYFNIEEINIKPFKIPRTGSKYNMFTLNKTYSFSKILKTNDLSNLAVFSVFITQSSGTLSNDTSELELFLTF